MRRFAIVLLVLAVPAAAQDDNETLRGHVRTYAKNHDLASKAAILKAGPQAIRVLYQERASLDFPAFDDISDLLYTLRFKSDPGAAAMLCRDHLAHTERVLSGGEQFTLDQLVDALTHADRAPDGASFKLEDEAVRYETPVFIDPLACASPETLEIVYPANYRSGKAYIELDRALAREGLDWAFRYGAILVSTPARLWPGAAPRKLTAAEQEHLKKLVADLDAADPETRTRASREIAGLGPEALPALQNLNGSEEARARAVEVVRRINALHGGCVYGLDCAMDQQKLEGDDQRAAQRVNDDTRPLTRADFTQERLDAVLSALGREAELRVEVSDVVADLKITLHANGLRLRDALMLITRTYGLDFTVQKGGVVVEPAAKK